MKWIFLAALTGLSACARAPALRGTGDLGVVVARATGELAIVETSGRSVLHRVSGLGDLSHASVVFSRDARHAFVFGRDGGLSKVDLLTGKLVARRVQAGNAIGGAISQSGELVAVSNYEPGGVRIFRASDLEPVAELPSTEAGGLKSKTVGLIDLPGERFGVSLFEAGEIWILDCSVDPAKPAVTKFKDIGKQPYDALISPEGRYYLAGLFGEDGFSAVDLWHPERGAQKVLPFYGKGQEKLPVYKMPHLEGWAMHGSIAYVPGVGRHEVLVLDLGSWKLLKRIPVAGQPVFVVASPDGRSLWVNFALPDNHLVQVIDLESLSVARTLEPGKGVLHIEFTPKGEAVWLSLRDEDRVDIYATRDFRKAGSLPVKSPSGIFFTPRAHRIGL